MSYLYENIKTEERVYGILGSSANILCFLLKYSAKLAILELLFHMVAYTVPFKVRALIGVLITLLLEIRKKNKDLKEYAWMFPLGMGGEKPLE